MATRSSMNEAVLSLPVPQAQATTPRSESLLGVRFRASLPWYIDPWTVEWAHPDEVLAFLAEHGGMLSDPNDGRWIRESLTDAKLRFLDEADRFAIRDSRSKQLRGVVVAHPSDWSTYYIRTVALLPEVRGTFALRLLSRLFDELRDAGVARVESDVSPNNRASLSAQLLAGFQCVGTLNTTRWGSVMRLCRFLASEETARFETAFCASPAVIQTAEPNK